MKVRVVSLLFLFSALGFNTQAQDIPYVEGEVLVRYLSSVQPSDKEGMLSAMGAKTLSKLDIVPNLELVQVQPGQSVEDAVKQFQATPGILYASPNYIYEASAGIFPPRKPEPRPGPFNDPYFYRSYGIDLIGAPKAWTAFTTGSCEIIVGVIDTGVDYRHEDLAMNIWKNKDEIPNNGIDDDDNGFIDDVVGWNFVNNTNNPMDDNRHGTHVAGTIGAVAGNNVGTIGVSPKVSIMVLKFLDDEGRGSLSGSIEAINYAVTNGARILNNSWGGHGFSQALQDAIEVSEQMGVLFVAAAGNDNRNNDSEPVYPASFPTSNIISVAATDRGDNRAWFSNYGRASVDLGAPGVAVYSTFPNNNYGNSDGTSMASPHVAGAAALILGYKRTLGVAALKDLILNSADPVGSLQGITVSGGRVNVFNAMALGLFSF